MGQIAFWSPQSGQTATSSNMIATAIMISLEYVMKTVLSHTAWKGSMIDETLLKERPTFVNDVVYSNVGIDALERLARSNQLSAKVVKDYVDTILPGRLELLRGTAKPTEALYSTIQDAVKSIYEAASGYYNVTMIDCGSGVNDAIAKSVVQNADMTVVNLNQNLAVLKAFFNGAYNEFLGDKSKLIVLGQYDPNSKYTINNIRRMFKTKQPIYAVPRCAGYMDSINDRQVVEFFLRNKNVNSSHENYFFMTEVRRLAKGILEASGIDSMLYSDREQGA